MLPSASSLQRVMMCTPSGVLPQVQDGPTEATDSGNAIHRYLEIVAYPEATAHATDNLSPDNWERYVDDQYHDDCRAVQLDKLPGLNNVHKEIAFAYNPETGAVRHLGDSIGRDYSSLEPGEYPGTADVAGLDPGDGSLVVFDYKTGGAVTTPPATENWQLRMLVLGAAKFYGVDHGRIGICKTLGDVRFDWAEFSADDLARWRLGLLALRKRLALPVEQMSFRTGQHCNYCPSFTFCHAQTGLLRQVASAPNTALDQLAETMALSNEHAVQAYSKMRAIEHALKRVKQQIGNFARRNEIDLGDGIVYGEVKKAEESLDAGVTYRTLKNLFGSAVAEACVTIDVSIEGIKRGLKPIAKRGEHAAMVRATLAEIAHEGGITLSEKTELREHKKEK